MTVLGDCRPASDNVLTWWDDSWGNCKGGWRHRKVNSCARSDKGTTEAPWWQRDCFRCKFSEQCDNASLKNADCTDWFAEYNSASGVCECKSGFTSTEKGCTSWNNVENDAGDRLMVEIQARLAHIHSTGTLSTINDKRLAAFERFFDNMEKKAINKANSGCGKRGRSIHSDFIGGRNEYFLISLNFY